MKMKWLFTRQIGIHIRVLLAAVFLISATTFTLGCMGVTIINQFVTKRFDQRIEFMTRYLSLNSELGILIDEKYLLQGLAGNMLKESDIAGVEIIDHTGRILVSESRRIPGPFATVEKNVYLTASEENAPLIRSVIGSGNSNSIGRVRVTYSVWEIENLSAQMKERFGYIASVLTVLSCIVFYFISRSLVAPLIALADTARKVSMGNRTIRAVPGNAPEVSRLADAFNEMLESLADGREALKIAYEKITRQEALAEVGKFSMMIAHEFKNPLGIIKSALDILKTELNIPRENVPLVYAEGEIDRLNTLIESFLMFSRPAKPSFSRGDLNRLLEQVVMGFEIQHNDTALTLNCRIPETSFDAEVDFDLLSRCIGNIIKNACEANKEKGVVSIDVEENPDKWQVRVTDQGEGINEADRQKVFEPFFTTRTTGTGLGLAFADQVIKAHGGSITIERPIHGGCCFCITLFSNNSDGNIEKKEENGTYSVS